MVLRTYKCRYWVVCVNIWCMYFINTFYLSNVFIYICICVDESIYILWVYHVTCVSYLLLYLKIMCPSFHFKVVFYQLFEGELFIYSLIVLWYVFIWLSSLFWGQLVTLFFFFFKCHVFVFRMRGGLIFFPCPFFSSFICVYFHVFSVGSKSWWQFCR